MYYWSENQKPITQYVVIYLFNPLPYDRRFEISRSSTEETFLQYFREIREEESTIFFHCLPSPHWVRK